MKPILCRHCDQCKSYQEVELQGQHQLLCPGCKKDWGRVERLDQIFEHCPVCGCRQFYTSKDFNQALGLGIMAIGIILVPWSYGLSLPVFAGIDWLLHKRVASTVCCYKCGSEFRHLPIPKHLKPFMHHIGLKYDKYRK